MEAGACSRLPAPRQKAVLQQQQQQALGTTPVSQKPAQGLQQLWHGWQCTCQQCDRSRGEPDARVRTICSSCGLVIENLEGQRWMHQACLGYGWCKRTGLPQGTCVRASCECSTGSICPHMPMVPPPPHTTAAAAAAAAAASTMPGRGYATAYLNGSGGGAVASRPPCQRHEQCWRGYHHRGPCFTDANQGCAFPAPTGAPAVTNPFPLSAASASAAAAAAAAAIAAAAPAPSPPSATAADPRPPETPALDLLDNGDNGFWHHAQAS